MSVSQKYISLSKNHIVSLVQLLGFLFPDKLFLKILFFLKTGQKLHLDHPVTFGEKLQWLKLYNRQSRYTMMVDKYAVKDYVASVVGKEYVIPTIGIWQRPEEIDFDTLPDQFVLKTTHGGGNTGVIICKDKSVLDKRTAVRKLGLSLKHNIYKSYREWPYRDVPRRVIAEKYIEGNHSVGDRLLDYKFFCFHGEPKYCQVIQERYPRKVIDFFDMEWKHMDFIGLTPFAVHAVTCPSMPIHFAEMRDIARKLSSSSGLPFSRIDLYETSERPYFGEITFFPTSGFGMFTPSLYNEVFGRLIHLPQ